MEKQQSMQVLLDRIVSSIPDRINSNNVPQLRQLGIAPNVVNSPIEEKKALDNWAANLPLDLDSIRRGAQQGDLFANNSDRTNEL